MPYKIITYEDGAKAPIQDLAEEGRRESPYAGYEFAEATLTKLMAFTTIFVMMKDDTPVGFLAAFINEQGPILAGTRVATELFWYVTPAHRGSSASVTLVETYERWAKDNGCKLASMCVMRNKYMKRLGKLYEKLGYYKAEETYLKELT